MNNIENNTQNAPEEVKATAEEVKDNEKLPEVFLKILIFQTMCWMPFMTCALKSVHPYRLIAFLPFLKTTMCWVWHKRVLAKRLLIYCPCSP